MEKQNKKTLIIKIIFRGIAILLLLVGLFFSCLVAHLNDAPGFAVFGGTVALVVSILIYGVGEIVVFLKQNNAILADIRNKMDK